MRADPEPSDLVIVQKPKGAVPQGHASIDRVAIVNLLELEAWVAGVLAGQPIRLPSCFLDLRWEPAIRRPKTRRRTRFHSLSGSSSVALPAARPARASAASSLRASCEAANWRTHTSSSPSSSSSHRAIRSCSSAGRPESFAIAASSARVMPSGIQVAARPAAFAESGERIVDILHRGHDAQVAESVDRGAAVIGDHRWREESRQFEPAVTVRHTHHG